MPTLILDISHYLPTQIERERAGDALLYYASSIPAPNNEQPLRKGPIRWERTSWKAWDPSHYLAASFDNLTDGCTFARVDYNPFSATHGAVNNSVNSWHGAGSGNVQSDENDSCDRL
ncbi:hypothetical protein EDD18DRAFT_1108599 [Armillaria luteobubalina]|uniref:Uncharacterized protein n=1 Tax=Armillaria luteobubalina TaxID=153913 RepID=A0AA39PYX6_9AGAR|nr:hypothetical protein EDD18DRAFT_1108599 [Armillaria luteobubalina]